MYIAHEATIHPDGSIRLVNPIALPPGIRALVVVLDELHVNESALSSEASLAVDWNRPEEDAAWSYLQSEK